MLGAVEFRPAALFSPSGLSSQWVQSLPWCADSLGVCWGVEGMGHWQVIPFGSSLTTWSQGTMLKRKEEISSFNLFQHLRPI